MPQTDHGHDHDRGLSHDIRVFSDGVSTQLATVAGSVATGYVATLTVGIAA